MAPNFRPETVSRQKKPKAHPPNQRLFKNSSPFFRGLVKLRRRQESKSHHQNRETHPARRQKNSSRHSPLRHPKERDEKEKINQPPAKRWNRLVENEVKEKRGQKEAEHQGP